MRGSVPTWILAAACAFSGLAAVSAVLGSCGKCIAFSVTAGILWFVLVIGIRAIDRGH